MKICLISEIYNPSFGGQYSAINNIIKICEYKNIKYKLIHKHSFIYKNKILLNRTLIKSDLVHVFGGWTLFYLKINQILNKLDKKIILHTMGLFEPHSFGQKKFKKKIAWYLYQKNILLRANLLHCGSKTEESNLKKLNKNFRTIILPFCVKKRNIKKNYSKIIHKKCIFFSRLHNQKGLDKLIKAWKEINHKNWRLDIVGFGNSQFYKKKFNLENYKKIKFLKPVIDENKKFLIFDQYDFLALPSLSESFGLAILEALARRVPVLTTNNTPWSDIQTKNSGWIINNSLIELKLVLNEIFNTSDVQFFKKKKNTIKIVKNFNIERVSKLYLKAYKSL